MIRAFSNLVAAALVFAYYALKWTVYLSLLAAFVFSAYGRRGVGAVCTATKLCAPYVEKR